MYPTDTNPINVPRKFLKFVLVGVAILLLLWAAFAMYTANKFHVVSTNPNINDMATVTPFFKINFNKQLSKSGVSISSSPSIISSYAISGKQLILNLDTPTITNTHYTITVHSIHDQQNVYLHNLVFPFTPTYIAYSELPTDQRNALLKEQLNSPFGHTATFTGTSALINNGLTNTQVQAFEQYAQNFAYTNKITLRTVLVNQSSVTTAPLDGSGVFSLIFTMSINGNPYKAAIKYSDPSTIELFIFNTSGKQLYVSPTTSN